MTMALSRSPYRSPARAYRDVGLQTRVLSASPHEIITILITEVISSIRQARLAMQANNLSRRHETIKKAIDILDAGLIASIDVTESDGDVGQQMVNAYRLIIQQLLYANLHSDESHLDAAQTSMETLLDAWVQIAPEKT